MKRTLWLLALSFIGTNAPPGWSQDTAPVSTRYQALKCPAPSLGSTWAILDRNGANLQVDPYLSSLGQGESGTGMITSPPFLIATSRITFTLCGHDGQAGGEGRNYIALVDARKGRELLRTAPPQNDALQERVWEVGHLRGIEARIEAHDGNDGGAYAWMGIGRIDAGDALRVDFRNGMPAGWDQPEQKGDVRYETILGGVPFRRDRNTFTLIPRKSSVEIPCGFAAERLFFLGCTVDTFAPLETYGGIEIHYRSGSPDVFPLMCGFTLDGAYKLMSPSGAMYLHASGDPYQHYLVIRPRWGVIDKIRLVAEPARFPVPKITAITCETAAESEHLMPLPDVRPGAEETAWIESHGLSPESPDLSEIMEGIRRAHRIPVDMSPVRFRKHRIDGAFRSEGVAVADYNGDGALDIAAGTVYYAGPDWRMIPLLGEAKEYNRRGYSESFLCFADDVNGDGAIDLIEVGFPGRETYWFENPGAPEKTWKRHPAVDRTGNESPLCIDVDGDGRRELVFMHDGNCTIARPGADPAQAWNLTTISNPGDPAPAHGLGAGDVNGDGILDVVIPGGWWEGAADNNKGPWTFHPAEIFGEAQLRVADLDGDGDSDVLGTSAHGYGIEWSEQTEEGWRRHAIDDAISQTHAVRTSDLNGDGLVDFVTGKRFWAHNGHDPGSFQPAVLCWFEQKREDGQPAWSKHTIDVDSGVGLHFEIVDLDGDGLLDIVTSNKKGVYYFRQVGDEMPPGDGPEAEKQ